MTNSYVIVTARGVNLTLSERALRDKTVQNGKNVFLAEIWTYDVSNVSHTASSHDALRCAVY